MGCKHCTMVNRNSDPICKMCDSVKDSSKPSPNQTAIYNNTIKWECPNFRCRLLNDPFMSYCAVCYTFRNQNFQRGNAPEPGSEQWACPTCTFKNASIMKKCAMCQTSKDGANKDSVKN